jgi:riboflavin synthase
LWDILRKADMLKDLLKNAGLLVILAGVIVLGVVVITKVQTNTYLSLSLGLIIVGFLGHILMNRLVD